MTERDQSTPNEIVASGLLIRVPQLFDAEERNDPQSCFIPLIISDDVWEVIGGLPYAQQSPKRIHLRYEALKTRAIAAARRMNESAIGISFTLILPAGPKVEQRYRLLKVIDEQGRFSLTLRLDPAKALTAPL